MHQINRNAYAPCSCLGKSNRPQRSLRNPSLSISRSFLIILFSNPLRISSPEWQGMTVVLPSLCSKNMWLPSCLINLNPILARILASCSGLRRGNLAIYITTCCKPMNLSLTCSRFPHFKHKEIASRVRFINSSNVLACVWQPGSPITSDINHPSSSCSTITLNTRSIIHHCAVYL